MYIFKVRSENGYGFLRPGLKTGVENGIFVGKIALLANFLDSSGINDLSMTHDDSA